MLWSDETDEDALKDKLLSGNYSSMKEDILEPGDGFYVPPGRIHQLIALEDSTILETSTTHFEEDSYRLIKRRLKIALDKCNKIVKIPLTCQDLIGRD